MPARLLAMLVSLITTARLLLEAFAQASIPFLLRSVAQAIWAGRPQLEFHLHQLTRFQSLGSLPRPFLLHHFLGVHRALHRVIHLLVRHLF